MPFYRARLVSARPARLASSPRAGASGHATRSSAGPLLLEFQTLQVFDRFLPESLPLIADFMYFVEALACQMDDCCYHPR
jgi:hypothetical protein